METPNLKLIKKIAAACRKAGIMTFEGYGIKFTLDPSTMPIPPSERVVEKTPMAPANEALKQESLTEEELLFWSADGLSTESQKETE